MGLTHFAVNRPSVVSETVDGETIIVNLDTGCYYDVNHVGSYIFDLIQRGATSDQLVPWVTSRYEVDPDTAQRAVDGLVEQLLAEQIILSETLQSPDGGMSLVEEPGPQEPRSFVMPVLNGHTDMQDLLLLDPIHDVSEDAPPEVRW